MAIQNTHDRGFFHLAAVTVAACLILQTADVQAQTAMADSQEKSTQLARQAVWAKPGSSAQEV